jgi:hypothetical protein
MKFSKTACCIALLILIGVSAQAAETNKIVMLTEVPKEVLEKNKITPEEQKRLEAEGAKAAAEFEAFAKSVTKKKPDSK